MTCVPTTNWWERKPHNASRSCSKNILNLQSTFWAHWPVFMKNWAKLILLVFDRIKKEFLACSGRIWSHWPKVTRWSGQLAKAFRRCYYALFDCGNPSKWTFDEIDSNHCSQRPKWSKRLLQEFDEKCSCVCHRKGLQMIFLFIFLLNFLYRMEKNGWRRFCHFSKIQWTNFRHQANTIIYIKA